MSPSRNSQSICPGFGTLKIYTYDLTIYVTQPSAFFHITLCCLYFHELPWWLRGKEPACNAGDVGSIPGSGKTPGEGNGNPPQYSCLENSTDRGAWWSQSWMLVTFSFILLRQDFACKVQMTLCNNFLFQSLDVVAYNVKSVNNNWL